MPSSDSSTGPIVVVGAGLAGAKTVEALRDNGFTGSLTLIGTEQHLPYERPPLSKGYLKTGEGFDEATVHPQEWYADHDVSLRLGTTVVGVDPDAHEVELDSGERVPYASLVLATGSTPRRLSLPGADAAGVLTLRTVEDSDRLRGAFHDGANVVFIGGGWIGLEVASAAREAGATVTVLETLDVPLQRVLGTQLGQVFADLHIEHGVDLRTGVQIGAITAQDGQVTGVELADGTIVPADTVVVGIGAAPNVELAEKAGLDLDNGVLVDASGRTSNPAIYAVGDIANAERPPLGRRVRVEHWANALNQPAAVAATIVGEETAYDELPYFFTDQYDLGMEYVGLGGPDDDVVVRGDTASREFIAFWLREGNVVAGMAVNIWDVIDDVKALILSGAVVDQARLADSDVPLADLS